MRCPSCKNDEVQDSFTTYFSNSDGHYVIIENVPCRTCTQCGEEFFTLSVMKKIDSIISSVKAIASKIFILNYNEAA